MPKVSIIVPNYNHAPFLAERLDSILNQTFQDYELIILDDCSIDGSQDIIYHYKAKFPHIKVFNNLQNSGSPFKQWDFGVTKAKGEYVWIAESDDVSTTDFLEKMVPILENNHHIGLAYCNASIIDEKGQHIRFVSDRYLSIDKRRRSDYVNNGKDEIRNYLCINNTINNVSGVLFRKTDYINAGFAYTGMYFCGDWFLYLRMLLNTDISYVSDPLNFIRIHDKSTCHQYYIDNRYLGEVIQIYSFIIQNLSVSPRTRKRICNEISRHLCSSFKNGSIPSKNIFNNIRKIAPFFELDIFRFIPVHIIKKYIHRYLPLKFIVKIKGLEYK